MTFDKYTNLKEKIVTAVFEKIKKKNKQRTTSLFLFMIQQLCYSQQNKNFSIK